MKKNLVPVNGRVIIQREKVEESKVGSIIIPETVVEKPSYGVIVGMDGVDDKGRYGIGSCVYFGRYAGTEIEVEGELYIIVNKEDIIAVKS